MTIGHVFVKASWQEEADQKQLSEDLKLSEKHFAAFLAKAGKHDEAWQTAQLLIGEIKRRLKNFDESKKHFNGLKAMKEFQGNHLEQIIDYQLTLIEKRTPTPIR